MTTRQIIPIAVIAIFFLVFAYAAQEYHDFFASLMGDSGFLGLVLYIGITVLATVIPPVSSIPLIPLASSLWGPFATAVASIIGWFIGAVIAFGISRKYGRPLAEKFVSPERLGSIERDLEKHPLFWSIVVLQMVLPVDVLSYALGLFKTVPWKTYVPATAIGIVPFAFAFAYAGSLPWRYQLPLLGLLLLYIWFYNRRPTRPLSQ